MESTPAIRPKPARRWTRRGGLVLGGFLLALGVAAYHWLTRDASFIPIGRLQEEKSFGEYRVRVYHRSPPLPWVVSLREKLPRKVDSLLFDRSDDQGEGSLEILKNGRRVYGQHSYSYDLGLNYPEFKVPPMGADLNGDGQAELVVYEFSGGAHCCFSAHVFQIGREFRELTVIEGEHSEPRFVDVDHDGVMEVKLEDWSYQYWPMSFAGSPAPTVMLRWRNGAYHAAADLMNKPPPSKAEWDGWVAEIRKPENWPAPYHRDAIPTEIFVHALDLMYAGHEELGWKFIREAWPPGVPVDEALLAELRQRMSSSPYWRELQEQRLKRTR